MGLERLEQWQHELGMKKEYFMQRKNWARSLVERLNLANQDATVEGMSVKRMFGDREYTVSIGPRGVVKIYGILPWQGEGGSGWFAKTPKQRKRG